jgi:hypothetical protein
MSEKRKPRAGKGGAFVYAGAIYSYYDDIRELKADGFTFATICKFLEGKGMLPPDADRRSFCRAFRREAARRKRAAKAKKTEILHGNATKAMNPKGDTARREVLPVRAAQDQSAVPARQSAPDPGRLVINPDNTFNIREADLSGLPDPDSIK